MLEKIKFESKLSKNQKDLFTTSHTKFDCKIEYKGKLYSSDYQCNINYSKVSKENFMVCILSDADAYDCSNDFEDFCDNMGYTETKDYKSAKKIFNACKKISEFLDNAFSDEEREQLEIELEDYR